MTECYIGLGSNLDDPRRQVETAIEALDGLPDTALTARSPWYRSEAVGPGEQPHYINGVARMETTLDPRALLAALQRIELAQGRVRGERWGPRSLDLDMLLYGALILEGPELVLPHPRMCERPFVLYPLYDLAPELTLPRGTPLESLLAHCPRRGLQLLGEPSDPGV